VRFLKANGMLIFAAVGLFLGGISIGIDFQKSTEKYDTYKVYSEGSLNPWIAKGLDDAEKKAHYLVYECDAKLAIITDKKDKLIAQIRKGDGQN